MAGPEQQAWPRRRPGSGGAATAQAGPSEKKAKSAEADDGAPGGSGEDVGAAPIEARTDFSTSSGWFPALGGTVGAAQAAVKLTDSLTSWTTVVSRGPHLGSGRRHPQDVG